MENLEKILNKGEKMTYADYMQAVLYDPIHGYYMKPVEKIGKRGDFYTSANLGDVFGRVLGKWFIKVFRNESLQPAICEIGAGTGKIAEAILAYIQSADEELFCKLTYTCIETSPYHRTLQQQNLQAYPNVQFAADLEALNHFNGIVFSNELFDAFPVHVIEKKHGELQELFVECKDGQLTEVAERLKNEAIVRFLDRQQFILKEGQRLEIPLQMTAYLEALANRLDKALVVTFDYGYTNEEWREPAHRNGSLRGYRDHRMIADVLQYPGQMDITSHIHFDALRRYGEEFGMKTDILFGQAEFLMRAGILDELQDHYDSDPFSEKARRNRAIRQLIMPGGISSYFRTLIQTKNMNVAGRII